MDQKLKNFIDHHKKKLDQAMFDRIEKLAIPKKLKSSMLYSLQAGGKRLRPILLIATYLAYHTKVEKAYSSAIALEMIHTYSLIHDDLPAMDDDDYRRGQLTNHKKFDEATAILAGDALLTYGFEIIANDPLLTDQEKVFIIRELSEKSGPKGMIAGQTLDIDSENKQLELEALEQLHTLKTGQLLIFAIMTGAYLGKASEQALVHLKVFATYLGLVFQIQDDILDVVGDPEKLGKPIGSDVDNDKSTYPQILGLQGATEQKELYVQKAKQALDQANMDDYYLHALTDYLMTRQN